MSVSRLIAVLILPCLLNGQAELSPILGGLPPGSGIAAGVEVRKPGVAARQLDLQVRAIGSVKRYEFLESLLTAPQLAGGLLFADVGARYRNYPEEDFWGLGPDTTEDRRSTFRLEDFDVSAGFGIRPVKGIEGGFSLGTTMVNTGPGKDGDWPSIERVFSADEVPALGHEPDYFHWGVFARTDHRDRPDDPRRGGLYEFRWTSFHQQRARSLNSCRYEISLRHFFPVFGDRDTIAARAHTVLSEKPAGGKIPFYLQPAIGGGNDLRGHNPSRFRDENALVLNLEYRWRVREIVHVVGFADAGRVFRRPGQIGFARLHGSGGAGTRFKLGARILAGFDVGWSREGIHIWFRSDHTF